MNTTKAATTKTWPKLNPDGTLNVPNAEKELARVKSLVEFTGDAKMFPTWMSTMGKALNMSEERTEAMKAAAEEMADILNNKDNKSGYHLNHIKSGKTVYALYSCDNNKAYFCGGEFESKPEAEIALKRKKEEIPDSYIDEQDGIWYLWYFDEEVTQDMLKNCPCGEYIADFPTEEEAMQESEAYQYTYIEEVPEEEWWAIVRNDTGEYADERMFPTEVRALVFLYGMAQPEAWLRYVEIRDREAAEKKAAGEAM